jgi:DNA polymerase III subunit chi
MRIDFYHLTASPLEEVIEKLLQKIDLTQTHVLIRTGSEERADALSSFLWTHLPNSFFPNGTDKDKNPEEQPIYITCQAEKNPSKASFLFIVDGEELTDADAFTRCFYFFHESDVETARKRWKEALQKQADCYYWKKNNAEKWECKFKKEAVPDNASAAAKPLSEEEK